MSETSISLLERLRLYPDEQSWERLTSLYTPLLYHWLRSQGLTGADADDLVQETLAVVVKEIPNFRHNRRPGAFRRWLRLVLHNRLRAFRQARKSRPVAAGGSDFLKSLDELADDQSDLSAEWDRDHDRIVLQRLLEFIRPEFQASTWQAFHRQVIDGRPAADVAAELDLSVNAVLIAKSRVLSRLRREGEGFID